MNALVGLAIGLLLAGWFACGLVLAFLGLALRELVASSQIQRLAFAALGALLLSPALVPVATLYATPLPLGFMLIFIRSAADLTYFARIWWFLLPSVAVTFLVCWLIARRVFPNYSLKRTAADGLR